MAAEKNNIKKPSSGIISKLWSGIKDFIAAVMGVKTKEKEEVNMVAPKVEPTPTQTTSSQNITPQLSSTIKLSSTPPDQERDDNSLSQINVDDITKYNNPMEQGLIYHPRVRIFDMQRDLPPALRESMRINYQNYDDGISYVKNMQKRMEGEEKQVVSAVASFPLIPGLSASSIAKDYTTEDKLKIILERANVKCIAVSYLDDGSVKLDFDDDNINNKNKWSYYSALEEGDKLINHLDHYKVSTKKENEGRQKNSEYFSINLKESEINKVFDEYICQQNLAEIYTGENKTLYKPVIVDWSKSPDDLEPHDKLAGILALKGIKSSHISRREADGSIKVTFDDYLFAKAHKFREYLDNNNITSQTVLEESLQQNTELSKAIVIKAEDINNLYHNIAKEVAKDRSTQDSVSSEKSTLSTPTTTDKVEEVLKQAKSKYDKININADNSVELIFNRSTEDGENLQWYLSDNNVGAKFKYDEDTLSITIKEADINKVYENTVQNRENVIKAKGTAIAYIDQTDGPSKHLGISKENSPTLDISPTNSAEAILTSKAESTDPKASATLLTSSKSGIPVTSNTLEDPAKMEIENNEKPLSVKARVALFEKQNNIVLPSPSISRGAEQNLQPEAQTDSQNLMKGTINQGTNDENAPGAKKSQDVNTR